MDHAETLAKAVVEAIEPGCQMRYLGNQSLGEHDFDLLYGDGRVAALEVTSAVDKKAERMVAAIENERKGGMFVPRGMCKQDWSIHLEGHAIVNKVRTDVDGYLAAVETDCLDEFFSPVQSADFDSVRRIWEDLGVLGGHVTRWNPPGRIALLESGGGGVVAISDFTGAVLEEAVKPDNLQKLRIARMDERHLFVYIHPRKYLPWVAFVGSDPPPEPVTLPSEITHVWAATEGRSSYNIVVWRARQGEPWLNRGPVLRS